MNLHVKKIILHAHELLLMSDTGVLLQPLIKFFPPYDLYCLALYSSLDYINLEV